MPIHGEYKHLVAHREIAKSMGMPETNIFVGEIGKVLEVGQDEAKWIGTIPAGNTLVDGYGIGDVGNIVLRDRRHLAEDGIIIIVCAISQTMGLVSGPDIVSRGFVYVRESEELMDDVRTIAGDTISECIDEGINEWAMIKAQVKDDLSKFIYGRTKRRPMILPIILEA